MVTLWRELGTRNRENWGSSSLGDPDSLRRWKDSLTHFIKQKLKTFKLDKFTWSFL